MHPWVAARSPARTPSSRRRKSSRASRRAVHITFPESRWVAVFHHSELSPLAPPRSHMDIRGDVDPRKDSGGSPIARSGLYCMSCLANWVMYVSCQPRRFRDVFESRLASVSLLPLYQRCARTPRCHILMSLYIWGLRSPRAVLPRVIANQVATTLRLGVCVLGE